VLLGVLWCGVVWCVVHFEFGCPMRPCVCLVQWSCGRIWFPWHAYMHGWCTAMRSCGRRICPSTHERLCAMVVWLQGGSFAPKSEEASSTCCCAERRALDSSRQRGLAATEVV